jgi:RNA polymerase sigma factor (sigma-70 family)
MPARPFEGMLQFLRRAAVVGDGPGASDAELLERFVRSRDESAFELLVWRHSRTVLGVCRRLLRDEHAVEDCFQAAFLALARQAPSVSKGESVGGWLYKVACRVARKAQGRAIQRVAHERPLEAVAALAREEGPCSAAARRELEQALDEQVRRLPTRYREVLVLCDLADKSHAEAARELGCPVGTVESRLSRARQRLRAGLARRGFVAPAGLLTAGLARGAPGAEVAAALVTNTAKAAVLVAAGRAVPAGVASARAAAWAKGACRAMSLARLTGVLLWVPVLAVLGLGAGLLAQDPHAGKPTAPKRAGAPSPRPAPAGPKAYAVLRGHAHPVLGLAFGPDDLLVTVAGEGKGSVRLWDAGKGKQLASFDTELGPLQWVAFSPDATWVAFGQKEGMCLSYGGSLDRGRLKGLGRGAGFGAPGGSHWAPLTVASDGKTWALRDKKDVRLLEADFRLEAVSLLLRGLFKGHAAEPCVAAFSADDELLASGDGAGEVRLWYTKAGKGKTVLKGHKGAVTGVAFSPDGKLLASCGADGTVRLWDVGAGKAWATLEGHTGAALCLAFAPDGKSLASGGEDRTVRVWDVASGKEKAAYRGHGAAVRTVAFSRDGKILASAGEDKTVRLWRPAD